MPETAIIQVMDWITQVSAPLTAAGLGYALKQAYNGLRQTHQNSELIKELKSDVKTVKQRVNQLEDHHNGEI